MSLSPVNECLYQADPFSRLPPELIVHILEELVNVSVNDPLKNVMNCSLVNRRFYTISQTGDIWALLYQRAFPHSNPPKNRTQIKKCYRERELFAKNVSQGIYTTKRLRLDMEIRGITQDGKAAFGLNHTTKEFILWDIESNTEVVRSDILDIPIDKVDIQEVTKNQFILQQDWRKPGRITEICSRILDTSQRCYTFTSDPGEMISPLEGSKIIIYKRDGRARVYDLSTGKFADFGREGDFGALFLRKISAINGGEHIVTLSEQSIGDRRKCLRIHAFGTEESRGDLRKCLHIDDVGSKVLATFHGVIELNCYTPRDGLNSWTTREGLGCWATREGLIIYLDERKQLQSLPPNTDRHIYKILVINSRDAFSVKEIDITDHVRPILDDRRRLPIFADLGEGKIRLSCAPKWDRFFSLEINLVSEKISPWNISSMCVLSQSIIMNPLRHDFFLREHGNFSSNACIGNLESEQVLDLPYHGTHRFIGAFQSLTYHYNLIGQCDFTVSTGAALLQIARQMHDVSLASLLVKKFSSSLEELKTQISSFKIISASCGMVSEEIKNPLWSQFCMLQDLSQRNLIQHPLVSNLRSGIEIELFQREMAFLRFNQLAEAIRRPIYLHMAEMLGANDCQRGQDVFEGKNGLQGEANDLQCAEAIFSYLKKKKFDSLKESGKPYPSIADEMALLEAPNSENGHFGVLSSSKV